MMHLTPRLGRQAPPNKTRILSSYTPAVSSHPHQEIPSGGIYAPHNFRDAHELQDTYPSGVRYARPDVTVTRITGTHPQDWEETNFSFGLVSLTPDLACPISEEGRRTGGGGGGGKEAGGEGGNEGRETGGTGGGTEGGGGEGGGGDGGAGDGDQWVEGLIPEGHTEGYQPIATPSHHGSLCMIPQMTSIEARLSDALGLTVDDPWHSGRRLSRSLEDLPTDIQDHILKCQCSCDHLGYGNFSAGSLSRLKNGCSAAHLIKTPTHSDARRDVQEEQEEESKRKKYSKDSDGGGLGAPTKVWVCVVLVLAGVAGVGVGVPLAMRVDPGASFQQRLTTAQDLLGRTPLFDGHNDLPWNIRKFMHNKLHSFNFTAELNKLRPWSKSSWSHTDLPRLKEGMVGAQFWVSYVPCASQQLNAVQLTIEQIDLIKRLIDQYPDDLRLATSADEVEEAFKERRIASLIGVEGGHAIQNSLGVLRALRDLGVRYLTLTHTCSTSWAESARAKETDEEDPNSPRGLTHFGKTVVKEMNRLGLLVDLSHVSQATMKAALDVSKAPVIFSHSSVYAICKNPRNVPDDILRKVAENGGIVMVSFYNQFLTCSQEATISDVIEHINHVRKVAGVDHVGIGADFDGINMLPVDLGDVSGYPKLFAELLSDRNWSLQDLRKLAGLNLIRVMREAEKVRHELQQQRTMPYEEEIPMDNNDPKNSCFYKFIKTIDENE